MASEPRGTRLAAFAVAVALLFTLLVGRLWQLQVVQGAYYLRVSEENRLRDLRLPAPRGILFDRKGRPLVSNRAAFTVSVLQMELRDPERVLPRLAEILGLSCVVLGRKVDVKGGKVVVERITPDGYEVVEAALPALVTVSNELGQPRYPTLRGIMAATRKRPIIWSAADLGIDARQLRQRITLHSLFVPVRSKECEIIKGETAADAGRRLALKLREAKLI